MARAIRILPIVLIILLVVGVAGGVAGSAYTSTSSFCTSCHEMSTRYVSWTRSTHNKVECMDCHSGTGLGGYIKAKIGGARQMVQHYFGEIGNIHAVVEDPVCMKCHFFSKSSTFQADPAFGSDPLYIADALHRAHFSDPESTCTACHSGMVHGSLEGGVAMKKEACDNCHRRKKVLAEIQYDGKTWSFPAGIRP